MGLLFESDWWKVYRVILKQAPRWLSIMGYETFEQFASELTTKRSSIIQLSCGYVVVNEYVPGVRITLHPCFTGKQLFVTLTEFEHIRDMFFSDYAIHRIEIRVFETAGHTVRKLLTRLGFTKEAVLRNYARDLCSLDHQLISSEIWSIVK